MRAQRVVIAVSVALAGDAVAAPLSWRAPAGCPSEREVAALVTAELGAPLERFVPQPAIDLVASRRGARWVVRIASEIGGTSSERELVGDRCAEVARAAALVVAMAVYAATRPAMELPPVAAIEVGAPPPPPAALEDVSRPVEDEVALTWLSLSLHTATSAGVLPGRRPGFGLGAGVDVGPTRIEAAASYWLERRHELSDLRGADLDLVSAAARLCVGLGAGFDGCGGAELGLVRADDFGVQHPDAANARFAAASARLAWRGAVDGSMNLVVAADLLLALSRPRFYFPEPDRAELFASSPIGGRLEIAFEWSPR